MKKSIFFALALSIAALNAQAATYWCNLNSLNGHYVARGNGDETIINGTLQLLRGHLCAGGQNPYHQAAHIRERFTHCHI